MSVIVSDMEQYIKLKNTPLVYSQYTHPKQHVGNIINWLKHIRAIVTTFYMIILKLSCSTLHVQYLSVIVSRASLGFMFKLA